MIPEPETLDAIARGMTSTGNHTCAAALRECAARWRQDLRTIATAHRENTALQAQINRARDQLAGIALETEA